MSALVLVLIFVSGLATGVLGSMLGIGGGVLIIPILIIGFSIPVHTAIAASIISVIATSSAAASVYLGNRLTNIRLGMTLEIATTTGGMVGGLTAVLLSSRMLMAIFGTALFGIAAAMWRRPAEETVLEEAQDEGQLGSHYYDPYLKRVVRYRATRLPLGLGVSLLAGILSGLLGIGGGVIKVPTIVLGMKVPMKAAAATSNFMIGVTAVASAYIYYTHRDLDLLVAAPTAMGVFLGSLVGARSAPRIHSAILIRIFAAVLIVLAIEMILRTLGVF